jgi:hypothetical protein
MGLIFFITQSSQTQAKGFPQNSRLFHERGNAQQQFIRFEEETKFMMSGARALPPARGSCSAQPSELRPLRSNGKAEVLARIAKMVAPGFVR